MFLDRADAGRKLAERLRRYRGRKDLLVLALPRGGVPVAYEVARDLGAELDVLVVRKLGVPFHPELAMGAIASGGAIHISRDVIQAAGISQAEFEARLARERAELQRREAAYRGERPPPRVKNRTVIVVDDGIATGASMHAALAALRSLQPAELICAAPVAPADSAARFTDVADAFVCIHAPAEFQAVGQFYRRFDQTSDAEVQQLLAQAGRSAT
ncbi:MAG: phosphoribosyltransferase [Gammaproteobacteria bacterium]|nr:phosphoribosyltransferase [Gammaproteobacteria bacterium]